MPAAHEAHDAISIRIAGVEVHNFHLEGAVPGVVALQAAALCGPGQGLLQTLDDSTLSWQAPGSAIAGPAVAAASDGDYLLEDGEDPARWLRIRVYAARLQPAAAALVTLAERYANGVAGDDVTAAEAADGNQEGWMFDLVNESAETVTGLSAWIEPAAGRFAISADGATWLSEPNPLFLGDLAPAASLPLYVQRTISPDTLLDPQAPFIVRLAWFGSAD